MKKHFKNWFALLVAAFTLGTALPASGAASSGIVDKMFIRAGAGAVSRPYADKMRDEISVEDFGAIGNGVADDTAKIQAAINHLPNGGAGAVRFKSGKTYRITGTVFTNNRSIVLEGNNATLLVGANMTYGISVNGTNTEIRNLQINRASSATVTAAVYMTGLQHVVRNVTSRAQVWPVFILAQDLKESHFSHVRVDNDPTNKTGIIFKFDYSVNNTVSDSMLGFAAQAFYGSSAGQPTSGYHNEGLLISNVIVVFAGKAVNFDNGTFIAIVNSCFDFIENIGVFMSNGTDLNVMNTWIASNRTNGFIGVGTTSAVDGVSLQNNVFVRGAAAITRTAGVSLSGPNVLVIGNRFKSGMNGGVVTQSTSQVIGNNVSGGGTNIVANASAATVVGKLAVEGTLTVGTSQAFSRPDWQARRAQGNGAVPSQVAGYAHGVWPKRRH